MIKVTNISLFLFIESVFSVHFPECRTDYDLLPESPTDNTLPGDFKSMYHLFNKLPADQSRVVQIDGHNDMPWQFRTNLRNAIRNIDLTKNMRDNDTDEYYIPNHTDFARASIGGLTAQFWVAYVRCDSNYKDAVRHTMEQIDVIHRMMEMYPEDLTFCRTADEIEAAVAQGKLASLS